MTMSLNVRNIVTALDPTRGTADVDMFSTSPLAPYKTLEQLNVVMAQCTKCSLYSTALNCVPGEGSATAELFCVGEAPGATEDETGRPFVGAAGQLVLTLLGVVLLFVSLQTLGRAVQIAPQPKAAIIRWRGSTSKGSSRSTSQT